MVINKLVLVLLIVPLLTACPKTKEQEKKAEQTQLRPMVQVTQTALYGFAVADESGKRLRYLGTSQSIALENPASFTNAVCSDGRLLTIKYTGQKEAAPDSTYRDTVDNFDKMGGHYYEMVNGRTESDDICLMTDSGFYHERKWMAPASDIQEKLSAEARSRIEKARERKVRDSWGLFGTGDGRQLFLVLFERSGNDALAGIVMVSPAKLVFLDFKGSYEDETSVWRVSDGGELDATCSISSPYFKEETALNSFMDGRRPKGSRLHWCGNRAVNLSNWPIPTGTIFEMQAWGSAQAHSRQSSHIIPEKPISFDLHDLPGVGLSVSTSAFPLATFVKI